MNDEKRQKIALFRYGILAPLLSGITDDTASNKAFFRDASKRVYTTPVGLDTTISAVTLERWYYSYQKRGFDGLLPKKRNDNGRSRKLDFDMAEQIKYLKQEYPKLPATLIHQRLLANGTVRKGDISLSTVTRYINQLKLENKYATHSEMRRYERAHINEVWYGDSSTGLYITIKGKKHKVWIIAMIDDASRMITGIDVFFNDNYINVMSVLKSAITRYGKPKVLTLDNGSPYKNNQMNLLAARVGFVLNYNAPYTPVGKAKVERWFKTMKQQWMSGLNMNDYASLDELRYSLLEYVKSYNQTLHSSLDNKSPSDRFFEDGSLIKRLSDEQLEKSFLLEIERRVSADNVILIDNIEYEVDYRYSKQRIILRYSPDMRDIFLVNRHTGELEPIRLLNKHDNSHVKRQKVSLTGGESA
jgi:transposase InsO family protein